MCEYLQPQPQFLTYIMHALLTMIERMIKRFSNFPRFYCAEGESKKLYLQVTTVLQETLLVLDNF